MKTADGSHIPDEHLELHFHLIDGDSFNVDKEYVEAGVTDEHDNQFRKGETRVWLITNGKYERVIYEKDVHSVMVVYKNEYLDNHPDYDIDALFGEIDRLD